jgi:hypothetical protein
VAVLAKLADDDARQHEVGDEGGIVAGLLPALPDRIFGSGDSIVAIPDPGSRETPNATGPQPSPRDREASPPRRQVESFHPTGFLSGLLSRFAAISPDLRIYGGRRSLMQRIDKVPPER